MDFKNWFKKITHKKLPSIRVLIKLTLEDPQDVSVVEQLYLAFSQVGMQKTEKYYHRENNLRNRFAMIKNSNYYDWELIADQTLSENDDLSHVEHALSTASPASEQLDKCFRLITFLKNNINYYYNDRRIMKAELITYYTSSEDKVKVIDYQNYPYTPEKKNDDDDDEDWRGGGDNEGPTPPPSPRPGGLAKQPIFSLTAGEITQGRIIKE